MPQKNSSQINVLVTSAGSVNGVNVIRALQYENKWQQNLAKDISPKYKILTRIISTDVDILAPGLYMAEKGYLTPKIGDKNYIPKLIKICREEKIDVLIPILSKELPLVAKMKEEFQKIGVKLAVSNYKLYQKTENKLETNKFFSKINVPYPKTYIIGKKEQCSAERKIKFPAIIKPLKNTSGAKDVYKITDKEDLNFYKKKIKEYIVQEYIAGQEYTIDGLSDLEGKMIYCLPRKRLEVRNGMAIKSITEINQTIMAYTKKIVEGLKLVGPFNVQCIKKGRKLFFIEINNRFGSGGLPLAVGAGLNIPLDLIRMLMGKEIPSFRKNKLWIYDNIMMTRFQDALILRKPHLNKIIKI